MSPALEGGFLTFPVAFNTFLRLVSESVVWSGDQYLLGAC